MQKPERKIDEYWYKTSTLERPLDPVSQKVWNLAYDILNSVKSAIILMFVLFTFIIRPVAVNGDSMQPTLQDADWMNVSPYATELEYGDIVVIAHPEREGTLVKRIIAVGGDEIDIDSATGAVRVNGTALEEPYIMAPIQEQNVGMLQYPLTIPQGQIFVMGDNRNDSFDSRQLGPMDERYVTGVVRNRLLPRGSATIDAWKE